MKEPKQWKPRWRLKSSCPTPPGRLLTTATTTQHMSPITRQTMINIQGVGGKGGGVLWWRRRRSPLFLLVWFQFQKQGKDAEKVKQRLAEIANYVDKVRIKSAACTTTRSAGGRSVSSLRALRLIGLWTDGQLCNVVGGQLQEPKSGWNGYNNKRF